MTLVLKNLSDRLSDEIFEMRALVSVIVFVFDMYDEFMARWRPTHCKRIHFEQIDLSIDFYIGTFI